MKTLEKQAAENDSAAARVPLGGVPIDVLSFDAALNRVLALADSEVGSVVVTPNIQHIATLATRSSEWERYRSCDVILPDGFPIALAVRLIHGVHAERVAGADLLLPLLHRARDRGIPVTVAGGRAGSAESVARLVAGSGTPVMTEPLEGSEVDCPRCRHGLVERLAERPGLLALGIGFPRQEQLAYDIVAHGFAGCIVCCGAAIDFAAGALPRAPVWMRRANLEWLHRVITEPARLLPRYVRAVPPFLRVVALDYWRIHAPASERIPSPRPASALILQG
jgi:N-acetylglucosaminyldiphosphoundecaprenol N-acetyl-beta-D-mannosaminyltransferase